jgi:hypothetical protein
VDQHLAARGPFPAIALDMIHLKANTLQEIAKAMLREAEEIVWFFMQWPIHRSRQNQDAAVLE